MLTDLTRYSTNLTRYSTNLTWYSTILTQYSTILTRYSTILTWYSTILTWYSTNLTRYSTILTQYATNLTRYLTILTWYLQLDESWHSCCHPSHTTCATCPIELQTDDRLVDQTRATNSLQFSDEYGDYDCLPYSPRFPWRWGDDYADGQDEWLCLGAVMSRADVQIGVALRPVQFPSDVRQDVLWWKHAHRNA